MYLYEGLTSNLIFSLEKKALYISGGLNIELGFCCYVFQQKPNVPCIKEFLVEALMRLRLNMGLPIDLYVADKKRLRHISFIEASCALYLAAIHPAIGRGRCQYLTCIHKYIHAFLISCLA